METWFKDGWKYRDYDLPVCTHYHSNGNKKEEQWDIHIFNNGNGRGNNLPNIIGYYENGNRKYECWYLKGKLCRHQGPAVISYYENGLKSYETWYVEDRLECWGGRSPSLVEYYSNGNIKEECWCKRDRFHRYEKDLEYGYNREGDKYLPARITYFENGALKNEELWLYGQRL